MSDIIDISTEIKRRDTDKNCQLVMPDGSIWFKYSATYEYKTDKGSGVPEYLLQAKGVTFPENQFSIEFWAINDDDAKARIEAIQKTLKLEGQIYAEIEA